MWWGSSGVLVAGALKWVAVAGWQWYSWIEEMNAVRMVVVRMWQWQYWLRYGSLKKERKKEKKREKNNVVGICRCSRGRCAQVGGSGLLQLVQLDRGDECGHFETS
jgi:hypothetical protein